MEQLELDQITVGEIVTGNFRTSSIFKKAGIDFCCGGQKSFLDACKESGVNPVEIKNQIKEIIEEPMNVFQDFKSWEPAFLIDYIVQVHHKFVRKNLPELVFYTDKIASVHGNNHPELKKVSQLFKEINTELTQHLQSEEEVLFPAIKEVEIGNSSKAIIISEIRRMFKEHDFAGGAMDKINQLTNGYHIPDDACNTYRVALKMLEQFEDDLHTHVHLENNILFPKALRLAN